jgi:hypothetical protein
VRATADPVFPVIPATMYMAIFLCKVDGDPRRQSSATRRDITVQPGAAGVDGLLLVLLVERLLRGAQRHVALPYKHALERVHASPVMSCTTLWRKMREPRIG